MNKEDWGTQEIIRCGNCNRKCWKYWHVPIKGKIPEMHFCGPCYFNHDKRNKKG